MSATRIAGSRCGRRGFSLIELLISLAILALLATMAAPLMELTHKRQQEQELRAALREIRQAIDAYKQAVDEGKITRKADETGYPPSLKVLYEGVEEVTQKTAAERSSLTLGAESSQSDSGPFGRETDKQSADKKKKKKKLYFLRRLPRDPFYPDTSVSPAETWGKRSYESDYDKPKDGKDVYDVFSLSPETGLNGIPYREW